LKQQSLKSNKGYTIETRSRGGRGGCQG